MAEPPRKRQRRASSLDDVLCSYAIDSPAHYASHAPPTPFQQPLHLTSFSYSPTRQLLLKDDDKDSSLSYYRQPKLGSDLNKGFEAAVWRDGTVDEGLDALLYALETWASKDSTGAADAQLAKTAVITWRGMLTKLLLAVYEADNLNNGKRADGWDMNAMLVDDCLYLEESNPPAKLAAKTASEHSGPSALPSYYGYAFEAYCTTTSSNPTPAPANKDHLHDDEFSVPNTNVQWCSVVKTSLGAFRTLVGGEVDCVRPGADPRHLVATRDFVELKTNLVIQSQRDEVNFERHKLLKHYVQSFLLGVPTVTVGFRTRQGHLAGLQSFPTLEIPRLVRGKPHAWDPAACLASAEALVAFIRETLAAHRPASTRSSGEDQAEPDDYPVFRVSFGPPGSSSSGNGNGDARNPASSSSASASTTTSPMAVTIRLLSREEVEQQVLAGKQAVRSPPLATTTTTTTTNPGRDRIGFLPRRWVEAVHERRRKSLSTTTTTTAAAASAVEGDEATRASGSGDGEGDANGPPKSSPEAEKGRASAASARPVPPPPPPPLPPHQGSSQPPPPPPPRQQTQTRPTGVAALLKR